MALDLINIHDIFTSRLARSTSHATAILCNKQGRVRARRETRNTKIMHGTFRKKLFDLLKVTFENNVEDIVDREEPKQ